jgi:hypothetical protein
MSCRQYIAEGVVGFAKENPQVMVDVVPKPYRHPTLVASYCLLHIVMCFCCTHLSPVNGRTTNVSIKNMSSEEVSAMVKRVRDVSGFKVRAFPKWVLTKNSSIQGNWTPFTNA